MTLETIRAVVAWCSVINLGLLLLWVLFIWLFNDWIYRLHSKWIQISKEQFNAMHYGGMGLFKMGILLFNLVPYLAMRIVG
jgi:hypothetical protein